MIHHIPGFQIEDEGITNFERITTFYPAFPKKLGIALSAEGVYQVPDDATIVTLIHSAFSKSAKSPGFTRTVGNNDESREAFWGKILPKDFDPTPAKVGPNTKHAAIVATPDSADSTTGQKDAQEENEPATTSQKNGRGAKEPETIASDRDILSTKKNVGKKSHAIFTEYVELQQSGDYPIASAGLARAMIETTLKYHAKRLKCYEETPEQQQRHQSDLLDNVANKLKKIIAGMNLPYSADLVSSISNCTKAIPELNDVMHKDGTFAARPAVKTALAALASSVESLMLIPDAK